RMAYRYLDVQTEYQSGKLQKPLTAKHRGFLNLAYSTHSGWSFDYTLNAVGSKRIPNTSENPTAFQLASKSDAYRSEEHTSELQSRENLVCRLLLEKKKTR